MRDESNDFTTPHLLVECWLLICSFPNNNLQVEAKVRSFELENLQVSMETPSIILRRSIFTFLQKYQYFTTIAALLAFPFAASTLLLQSLVPIIPSSSIFFSILHTNQLSHTIAISVLAFPSTLSSFLFSKASVIHALMTNQECPLSFSCLFKLHIPLIHTQICNSLFTLSSLFIAFNLAHYGLGFSSMFFSAIGAVVFSLIVAHTFIICNLALILSATQKKGGFTALLGACILIKTRTATALSLALPTNAAMAAVEVLFQYRVVRAYHDDGVFSVALEGLFIGYLYALPLVLDTIVAYFFFTSCQVDKDGNGRKKIAQDQSLACSCRGIKIVEDLP
ncbi:uncharacterized protein LOC116010771 [Ipomoea triloba]|uniref:uncharacterized protein LOC116010771 n=1 Tax=Ipomoea triloba TaxID=35885 RepID=UPI00125E00EB|nr:uncharacterized protein LOC116010771 [Ipomoea triloba]